MSSCLDNPAPAHGSKDRLHKKQAKDCERHEGGRLPQCAFKPGDVNLRPDVPNDASQDSRLQRKYKESSDHRGAVFVYDMPVRVPGGNAPILEYMRLLKRYSRT